MKMMNHNRRYYVKKPQQPSSRVSQRRSSTGAIVIGLLIALGTFSIKAYFVERLTDEANDLKLDLVAQVTNENVIKAEMETLATERAVNEIWDKVYFDVDQPLDNSSNELANKDSTRAVESAVSELVDFATDIPQLSQGPKTNLNNLEGRVRTIVESYRKSDDRMREAMPNFEDFGNAETTRQCLISRIYCKFVLKGGAGCTATSSKMSTGR